MCFKLIVLCATVAAVSCTVLDHNRSEQYRNEQQQDFDNQQQRQEFFDSQRNQDQFNRQYDNNNNNDNRQQFNRRQNNQFNHHHNNNNVHYNRPGFVYLQPAYIHFPTSSRNFNVQDDSNYNFGYSVSDVSTGDYKSHQETRHGDKVQGQFTMIDSDGFQRTVNYRADDVNGFDAEVRRDPTNLNFQQQQQQFGGNFASQQFNNFNGEEQNAAFFNAATHPKSTASTQVTRVEDGQATNYATQTTNF